MTITDVASRAGVSAATVSRVLNRNYPVAEETRLRVLAAVRDLGYVANAHARALLKSTTGVVGVILHDVSDPYFAEIVRGIQQLAAEHGKLVLLCNSLREPGREISYVETLRAHRVDAIILAGGYVHDDSYLLDLQEQAVRLREQGSRLVLCGRHPVRASAVQPDNVGGASRLTRHLLEQGHRRIAHLSGPANFSTTDDRLAGYRGALDAFGVELDPDLVVAADFSRDGGYAAARALLDSGRDFTAVFAANDLVAVGALAAFRERGLRVPEDVSLAGFDDLPVARDMCPPLTTVSVPMVEIGRRCMELAFAEPAPEIRVVRLPTQLVLRGSVQPI